MDKKHEKYPQNGDFPNLWPPKIFFQKSGYVTFVPLWCPNFMQKWTNEIASKIFTDGYKDTQTNGKTREITKDKLRVQKTCMLPWEW